MVRERRGRNGGAHHHGGEHLRLLYTMPSTDVFVSRESACSQKPAAGAELSSQNSTNRLFGLPAQPSLNNGIIGTIATRVVSPPAVGKVQVLIQAEFGISS